MCNRALLELTGVPRDEVLGRDVRDFICRATSAQHLTERVRRGAARPAPRRGHGRAADAHAAACARCGASRRSAGRARRRPDRGGRRDRPGPVADRGAAAAGHPGRAAGHPRRARRRRGPRAQQPADLDHRLRRVPRAQARGAGRRGAPDLEKLRRIGASAQRILRFSRDLVQYARPSGSELEPVDVAGGRAPVGVVLRAPGRARRDRARASRSIPSCPVIQAVAGQLEQVLINLITNAVHAVETGGSVVVRARADGPRRRSCSRSPTPARASPRTTASGSSSRSSRPRPTARAPASACRSCATSSSSTAARSP